MKTKTYDTFQALNQTIKKYCRGSFGPSMVDPAVDIKARIRTLIGVVPVLAEGCHDNLVLQIDDDPEQLTVNVFHFVVFRRQRIKGRTMIQAVACIDIHDHDPEQEWPSHRQEIGEKLRSAGVAYVSIPTAYVQSQEYMRCTDFKRRIRRAVFSDKAVKFKPYPSLPLQPKRVIKGPSCR